MKQYTQDNPIFIFEMNTRERRGTYMGGIIITPEERALLLEKENKQLKESLADSQAKLEYIACLNYPEILDEEEEEVEESE